MATYKAQRHLAPPGFSLLPHCSSDTPGMFPPQSLCSACAHLQTASSAEQVQLGTLTRLIEAPCGSHTPNSPSMFEFWTNFLSLLFFRLLTNMNVNVMNDSALFPHFPSSFSLHALSWCPCRPELLDQVEVPGCVSSGCLEICFQQECYEAPQASYVV